MYYLYILQDLSDSEHFYTGSTTDLKRRVDEHNRGASAYTKNRKWRLVYYEAYLTLDAAREREATLKRNANMKRFLIDRIKKHL